MLSTKPTLTDKCTWTYSPQERRYSVKKSNDTIQFESRAELAALMNVLSKDVKQNPAEKDNRTLKEFYNLLDIMEMEW